MTCYLQDHKVVLCNAAAKQGGSIRCSHSAGAGLGCPGGVLAVGYRVPAGHALQVNPARFTCIATQCTEPFFSGLLTMLDQRSL